MKAASLLLAKTSNGGDGWIRCSSSSSSEMIDGATVGAGDFHRHKHKHDLTKILSTIDIIRMDRFRDNILHGRTELACAATLHVLGNSDIPLTQLLTYLHANWFAECEISILQLEKVCISSQDIIVKRASAGSSQF
jgi:hypothetical protein